MEQIYRDMISNIVLQYLGDAVDTEIYNLENLIKRATGEYLAEFPFQVFLEEVEEQVAEVLENNLGVHSW